MRFLLIAALVLAACGPADAPGGPEPQTVAAATPPAPAAGPTAATAPASDATSAPAAVPTAAADLPPMTVYKTPTCGCCTMWVDHMKASGFTVETIDLPHLNDIKARYGIAPQLQSCHTALVDGYFVEGHVPADDVKRLLAERPAARGIAVPGMPIGSPGMEMPDQPAQAYDVLIVKGRTADVFARH